jgi:hypothetical protein
VVHRAGTKEARILTFGNFVVDAYEPRSGKLAWRLPGFGATPVSSPIVDGDRLFAVAPNQLEVVPPPSNESFAALDRDGDSKLTQEEMAGSDWASTFAWLDIDDDGFASLAEIATQVEILLSPDHGLVAVDLAGDGGPHIVWRQKKTLPYIATPILYRGVLFLVKDGGILTSYDPQTGNVLKRARIEGVVESFSPSPVAASGRLYLTSSGGTVAVVSAEAQWETLAKSDLDEEVFASPAIGDGRLLVRTRTKLYSFSGK